MVEDVTPVDFVRHHAADDRWQLLDVREPWEVDIVTVSDARPIPMVEIPARLSELDKSQPLAVLCHSGVRSRRIAEFLHEQGFLKVVNIAGGIDAWAEHVDTSMKRY